MFAVPVAAVSLVQSFVAVVPVPAAVALDSPPSLFSPESLLESLRDVPLPAPVVVVECGGGGGG